jgi:hypothetical protein
VNELARAAYQAGDYTKATQLAQRKERLRQRATSAKQVGSRRLLTWRNAVSQNRYEIDLHGLHVSEAITTLESTVQTISRMTGKHVWWQGDRLVDCSHFPWFTMPTS